jgi:uncharacterized protein GlcG (DUF336 family)
MKKALILGLSASLLIASAAVAQTPAAPATTPATAPAAPQPPARRIEAALAKEAVEAAIAACTAQNLKISAAVVDAAGFPVYVYVPDGVRNGTGDIAIRKGITMMITGKNASETAALAAADPALETKLVANPRTVRFPGGVVLKAGDAIVGAIAASGVTGAQDEACAKAGAEKIAARIK